MGWWLDPDELVDVMDELDTSLPLVPRLYKGPYDQLTLLDLADGRESVSGKAAHLREGLVVRPAHERRSWLTGERAIAKFVSPGYLTRSGGTEFE